MTLKRKEKKIMYRLLFFVLLLLSPALQAQFTYVFDQSIPVTDTDGNVLTMPWAGGLNATQYNTMDLDHDGKDDLVLFDRMANKVITFLYKNSQYVYTPEYEIFFPAGISNWLLLRDFNCDGKKDIFTGDVLGIKVYQNMTDQTGRPAWKQFLFYSGSPFKSPVLLSKGFSSKINVQLQFDDLPAITDADGDGDLDIFNFRFVGNGTVEFHKNFSKERYGSCDSLDFERITQNWGNFRECACGVVAFNGEDCPTSGRTKHAGGKSLLAMDIDGDQDIDLAMAEAECTFIYQLRNDGTLLNPVVNSHTSFPPGRAINMTIYPTGYHEDVDADGLKDLVFSLNIFTKTLQSSDLQKSNQFYKNTGTASSPVYTYIQPDFLQDQMIDAGDNSVPAFADYDGDGDYDMFISRNNSASFRATVYLYENTGTQEAPSFQLINTDFLFFSFSEFNNLKIQFVDVDANSTLDLAFTGTSVSTGTTGLFLLLNNNQSGLNFFNQSYIPVTFNLTFNENVYFTDVDADGKTDILAGRGTGALEYWRNTGQPSQFQFTRENPTFLGLSSSVLRQNISTAAADLDGDGLDDLIFGDQTGKLKIVSNYRTASDASQALTEIVFNPLLEYYAEQNLGGRVWPTVVNLFNTNKPSIVTGNVLGGVGILRNDNGESLPDEPVIQVFPNPITTSETLKVRVDRPAFVQLHSVLGQKLGDPLMLQPLQTHPYSLPPLSAGIYLLKFTIRDKFYTKRFVVAE
jgi:hypothetical protein